MKHLRAAFKLLVFVIFCTSFFVSTFPLYLYAHINRYGARRYISLFSSFHAWLALSLFGIHVYQKEEAANASSTGIGTLIVSNHLSYLDVMIIAILYPSSFVTSVEMRNVFFLGQLCEAGGCLYVERRSRMGLDREVEDITNALKSGLNVVVFPESTSTNGEEVKRFKRPLFKAAIDSGANILPLTINYRHIDQLPVSEENRDIVCWYGDMTFFDHFWQMLKCSRIDVEITVGQEIAARKQDEVSELSVLSHTQVSKNFTRLSSSTC